VEDLVGQSWIVGAGATGSPEFGVWPGLEEPKIVFAVRGWPTRLGLVAAGLGIALVPGSMEPVLPRGVCWVPVRTGGAGLGRTTYAVTTVEPRPATAAVVHALVEEARAWGATPAGR
jgi:DNA-binding transcriptional LysR family regulator